MSSKLPDGSGIYRITCTVTGLIYIGSASNLRRRWSQHLSDLRNNKHINQKLQRAWNKHTEPNFLIEIVELVLPAFLLEREQYHLDKLQPFGKKGFNIARSAQSSHLGLAHTPETREKLRLANLGKSPPNLGKKHSPDTIKKMRQSQRGNTNHLGKVHSPEARAKMSAARAGKPSNYLGKKHTPETRAKLSAAKKGSPAVQFTPEVRAKISATNLGREVKPETRAKLSKANLGRKHSKESRAKIAAASLGRKHTPEARAKLSAAAQGNARYAKDYIVTSPEGVEYAVHNLKAFCQERQLTPQCLSLVAAGKRNHHRGWTARRISETE